MVMDPNVKGKLGFGCMRLPMNGDQVDHEHFSRMVDTYLEAGFNYFDTAHGYLDGKSESALKACLTSRYPRERYILTNKLSTPFFKTEEEIRPFFENQLEWCGVEYFDYYLMHAQNRKLYEKYKRCRAYEIALEFLAEGRIKHMGISFHGDAELLEEILTDYPQVEVVQLQFNYLDYEDAAIQGRKCYEVCMKHGKPVLVMEPVKGGSLAKLPEDAAQVLADLKGGSAASYAIRFAAGFDGVMSVLSGMGDMEMMEDNIKTMKDFKALDETERAALEKVCEVFRAKKLIACTACEYCVSSCPMKIRIPDLFACMNTQKMFRGWSGGHYYHTVHTVNNGKASACIKCGKCEELCPQNLPIRDLLVTVAEEFEKKKG